MRLSTTHLSGLLSLGTLVMADPTWPSSIDELEEIMYQVSGFNSRQFGGTVIPCSNEASGPGRQNAAEWLRTGFHDMATANINFGTGGLDASLQYELSSAENTGPGFTTTLRFMNNYYTNRSSVADLIALGVYYSVRSCGGPSIPFRGGRVDARAAGNIGVPQPENSVFTFQQQFRRMGFSNTEMIQVTACGHTIGGVHEAEFPNLVPPGSTPKGEAPMDSTVAVFDNKIVTEYISGNTTDPLVVGPSVRLTRNSDSKVFASDANVTVTAMADQTAFHNTCKNVLQKMIDVVPSGVTLSDPILPYAVKPVNMQLTLETGASTMALTGWVRVRVTSASVSSIALIYKDRNGGNNCGNTGCSYTATVLGATDGFDDKFIWFPLNVKISTSTGISSFTVTLNRADGTRQVFDNNGVSYPMDDAILIQKPQSCLLQTSGALTVTAAVRNDRNSFPVKLVVSQKVASGRPIATLSSNTIAMTRGDCVGPYTFYTASYTIPGDTSSAAKLDVVSGTGEYAIGDYFNAASELGGTCRAFSVPPASLCTTGSVTTTTLGGSSSTSSSVTATSTTSSSTGPATTLSHRQTMGGYRLVGCKKEPTTPGSRALSGRSFAYDGMTLETCMTNCSGFAYWGTEYGRECYCGDSLESTSADAALAECNVVCSGDATQYCGAGNRIELYYTTATATPTATLAPKPTVSPYTRVGCYDEVSGRALTGAGYADDAMTLEMCASRCAGFTYFAAEYGRECYCGNTLDARSVPAVAESCNMVCAGNRFEYCGAGDRLELYSLAGASSSAPAPSSSTTSSSLMTSTTSSSIPVVSATSSTSPGSSTSSSSTVSSSSVQASSASSTTSTTSTPTTPSTSSSSSATAASLQHRPTVSPYSLVGCWTEGTGGKRALGSKNTVSGASMTLEACAAFCDGYHYFGTEYGGECYCGNSLDETSNEAPLADCSMTCTGNRYQYCGAGNRLELYYTNTTTGPSQPPTIGAYSWYGCQTEGANDVRALAAASTASATMTLESCATFCGSYQHFGTEYGGECYCGDAFSAGSVAVPVGECSMTCTGNDKQYCGAGNRLSVYSKM
ncbi:copper radical oxidase [Pseudomassariella vexata]|uniref:Copper radical oxidase n=1 Tax=Pseudomassariella vexata TaxID=1141098 RepID=A0A1Y2EJ91_9PEZI|nr:copper radical oxidase [Pseudomassariella vexata]ORY71629.1 copper radical oxidase [Pseudomassariella vexata]